MAFFRSFAALTVCALIMGLNIPAAYAEVIEDTTSPSDVENVQVFPNDSQVTVTWDPATDDIGVSGYYVYMGLSSVAENGGAYTFGSTDVGDVSSTIMENLSNGVTYYFAVTAYDAAGNESEYYSTEVEATPEASETGDFTEPTVSHASALTNTLVEVEFSEDVLLPSDGASAFSIESSDGSQLEVIDAYLSDNDSVVFVVTEEQTAGAQYILTAGIGITDTAENPIVSGTSDTALFTGSSLETGDEPVEETPEDAGSDAEFMVTSVDAREVDELVLEFSQNVAHADPDSFVIQLLDDASQEAEVLGVSVEDTKVTLITTEMEAGADYLLSMTESVVNEDGSSLTVDAMSLEFTAATLDLSDLVAPEDVTEFLASVATETSAVLSWEHSVNSAGDLAEYLIYKSADEGVSFSSAVSVAMDLNQFTYGDLTPGATYTFKVTAVDENGNESEGVLSTVTLPETGPGMLAMFGLSLAGGAWASRRNKGH